MDDSFRRCRQKARRVARRAGSWLTPVWIAAFAGCGGHTTTPTPPVDPVKPISLTCPSDIRLENVLGSSRTVVYPTPTATGGVPPISVACSVTSGADFPLGDTAVVCQGTDGIHTAGQCHFSVTLIAAVPTLRFTKFMAFGDSITAGEVNDDTGGCVAHDPFTTQAIPWARPFRVQPDIAFPKDLERLLAARYTTQTPQVVNEGLGADSTSDGVARFASALRADNPQVVLVLQGVIDIADHGFRAAPIVSFNLHLDIEEARRRGVEAIFLSTLVPTRAPERLFRGCYATIPEIEAVNAEIRSLAARDGVTLVDSYAAFSGRETTLIGSDGLHPTAEGMQVIADTFFAAIKEKIEVVAEPARRSSSARAGAAGRD